MLLVGTYSFWFLAAAAIFATVSIAIKTKWWESWIGRNLFWIAVVFSVNCVLITFLRQGIFTPQQNQWVGFVIYVSSGIGLLWLGINVWVHSKTWAWTRSE